MLKWTVNNKRECSDRSEPLRPLVVGTGTNRRESTGKVRRRRSSTSRRRSTSRRSANYDRNSLGLEVNKENQFTSTPIKYSEENHQFDALRELSNLTPNDTVNRRNISFKKNQICGYDQIGLACSSPITKRKTPKKKKPCIDPSHSQDFFISPDNCNQIKTNYFKHFEAVDSHIEGIVENEYKCCCAKKLANNVSDNYAPTLPAYVTEYSPCSRLSTQCIINLNNNKVSSPTHASSSRKHPRCKVEEVLGPPNKKAKIDHVNDFLHQISYITSPEDERIRFTKLNSRCKNKIAVSPLVKQFVDLRFSRLNCNIENANDSSYINELSLDKIVDAILDKTADMEGKGKSFVDAKVERLMQERDNILNESHEENLVNMRNELQSLANGNSDLRLCSSGDHNKKDKFKRKTDHVYNEIPPQIICDKTIININETYNERCVDQDVNIRKRMSSDDHKSDSKRFIIDDKSNDGADFTLKRQKCIRRRKYVESEEKRSIVPIVNIINTKLEELNKSISPKTCNEEALNDVSLNSSNFSEKATNILNEFNGGTSTPLKEYELDETQNDLTEDDCSQNRRTRRCLLFESPKLEDRNSFAESSLSKSVDLSYIKGTIDVSIEYQNGQMIVNVYRCRDLHRANGKPINAYVKVALSDRIGAFCRKQRGLLQRTAVQGDSSKPTFNHTFCLPLEKEDVHHKRLNIEVWHRDRVSRKSEFLGCLSFAVKNAVKKAVSGSYRLLPQTVGRCQNVPVTKTSQDVLDVFTYKEESRQSEEDSKVMSESQSSVEEVISIDALEKDLKAYTNKTVLSQQQKDADENLFLRYLELDPTEGPEAIPAALQRKATGNKNGRTPFTTTKKLIRPSKSGFGFSVVWTHPPRIERVEKGLPADKAGILPGDYIIFVDKHNVVMMPEIDILNLIRSYGSQLTLEIFRRNASRNGSVPSVRRLNSIGTGSTTGLPAPTNLVQRRPSTVCSTNTTSVDYNRRRLNLPQVTFNTEKSMTSAEEARRKALFQLIHKEQQYATGLQFAVTRFVSALAERKDLITAAEHRTLFQNSEEILRITEDILDNLVQDDGDPQIHILARTYHAKLGEMTSAYRRYCSGIKKADCVLANKTKNCNSDFVRFLQTPAIPRRRPDITVFIHKPLEHYRDILKFFNVILSNTKTSHEDYPVISQIVHDLQLTYREMTMEAGLMEPNGEGRPLLSVQDLENRLVFTKCKPFVLSKPGRHWIFAGDLSRVEGRTVRQYWTLLFSDLLVFAKVSRDRVLFIIEDPLPLAHIAELIFNVRKKATEFRITVEPSGRSATSPTVHCGPDLTRTPKKSASKRTIVLRAPTTELKAVWQMLLQRQIFHVNAGMDGSSFSSPLESPEAPITSSVATLQSAESLSFRRQTPQYINQTESAENQRQIDALIEHKCKQLSKTNNNKGNAIHLEQWMKGQLGSSEAGSPDAEPEPEMWTKEMLQKRSEELHLLDNLGNSLCNANRRNESRCEEFILSDHESPSRSTTTESQVTVRSSPVAPETVPVCRQCRNTCLTNSNGNNLNNNKTDAAQNLSEEKTNNDWMPLMLMGLSAMNPAATLLKLDPFSTATVPKISVVPPTPESLVRTYANSEARTKDSTCYCSNETQISGSTEFKSDFDISPDDSPLNEEHPYHSLSSSNLTLRRYGTVSSLERLGTDGNLDPLENDDGNSSESEEDEKGIDNEAFNHSTVRSWTARAGSFVAEKMAFFEKLGEDYKTGGRFFERYLKTADDKINGDDIQEDETSGATSGEEIWGTPTSGGEMDDPLSSPSYDGRRSPNDGSLSSDNGEDTELMMDELLMTPPVTGTTMRGLLPRRTLEPLMEEEYSDSCSSSSSTTTPTEPSVSPEQGIETGDAADTCSAAVEGRGKTESVERMDIFREDIHQNATTPMMHRSESYRHIIEAEDDNISFFNRFKPTVKFINIERVPRGKSAKIFEFFNIRRSERRIHETYPEGSHLIKVFSKEGSFNSDVPTSYSQKPLSPGRLKDKQMDRRFWKQLSRRRGNKMPNLPA